ncbi:MAG: LPS-assembly protein LptD, partial [Deltaproteobacteria bacterium]|nr:LPS-assembly protein LptD [Deltaproteobacteria bacterium]
MKGQKQEARSRKQEVRSKKQRVRKKSCLLFFACCLFFSSLLFTNVFAETEKLSSKDEPIEITADSLTYDKSKDTYYAEGHVLMVQGKSSIRADKMTVDMNASHATAYGNVEAVDEGGNTLKGDNLELNIDTKVGVVMNGKMFFKEGNLHVTGEEIKKTGNQSYSAHKGIFTTCDCEADESPAWSFYSTDADVTLGKYLTAWNTLFYIKRSPVFYFPYLIFPVKTERETGFLPPRVGYSQVRGFKIDNSFFWAISES